nr:hypothetical protein [Tanacetum cinerariifolium]
PIIQYTRRARIAQSSALPTVADKPASLIRDDSQGEACPTDSGFIADQDRATIAKSSTLPRDSPPRVTSPVAEEGNDAPIKGRSSYEGESPTERISNDSEEIARVLTSMDAKTVLVGEANKKKLQEQFDARVAGELEEQQEREDMRMNEQIDRDVEISMFALERVQSFVHDAQKDRAAVRAEIEVLRSERLAYEQEETYARRLEWQRQAADDFAVQHIMQNPRNMHTARPCYYTDFMKCHPLNFKGTEGAVGLTCWIEKMESVFNISGCAVENQAKVKAVQDAAGAAHTKKSASTPIDAENPLLKDLDGEDVDMHTYRSMIGSLMYLTSSRPDIMFASTDVTRLQALVDKKKVVISEAIIRDVLRLDDVEGVDCLPNKEIFYWIGSYGSLSAIRTSWNEFSSTMASGVICLSTGRKFNFSKYIFDSLVRNVDSSSKFYMYLRFIQLIIQNQIGDLSTNTTKYISPALTQKVFANMKRIGKGFSGVETPLFEGMVVVREDVEADIGEEQIPDDTAIVAAQEVVTTAILEDVQTLEITHLKKQVKKLERVNKVKKFKLKRLKKVGTSQTVEISDNTIMEDVSNQGRMIVELDRDEGVELIGEKEKTKEVKDIVDNAQVKGRQAKKQAKIYQIDLDHPSKVLSMQEGDSEVQEAVEVVTTAKLITEVVNAVSIPVSASSIIIPTAKQIIPVAEQNILAVTITIAPVKVIVASTRRRRGVVIRDPEEESSAKTSDETKSKDKGKGILVEEPKPLKKKQQVKIDKAYARKLHEELNQDIDWDVAVEHVKQKAKEDPFIQRYQMMKKRPQTEAQARRNMIMYLKNTVGFKLDYFKGKSYDDIRLIFKAKFNTNIEFLLKSKEKIEEEESRALESINETSAQKAAKKRRLNQEDKDVEEIKQHLEIMPDEDDDIILLNNKPRYKIIKVDGTHQQYASFITVLKNFDRDDLETLWSIVKERFSTLKPNNFSDEYLLTIIRTMFGRPNGQDNVWKSQRSVHCQAMVKIWKLLTSCGVHIISFTTTQLILLVERRHPLSRFTLEQMLNVVRLQVEEHTLELMLPRSLKKNTKCVNAAGDELSAAKHKLMVLVYCC